MDLILTENRKSLRINNKNLISLREFFILMWCHNVYFSVTFGNARCFANTFMNSALIPGEINSRIFAVFRGKFCRRLFCSDQRVLSDSVER